MARKEQRMISPRKANTFDKVCSLQTDNKDTAAGWILVEEHQVVLAEQASGWPVTGKVCIPRAEFNRMVDWYNREQKARP